MPSSRPDRADLSDEEIVRLVQGGETDAFAEFVRRTRRPAYRLARRITRNHEDADDVLQESFVKAYRALDRFVPGKPIGPWFLTIVARTALSSVRRERRRSATPLDEPGQDGAPPLADRIADPSGDPRSLDRRLELERAFARLSEEHRVILALRVDADLPYAGIAEALGIPVGTVMSRLARAREALVEEMKLPGKVGTDEP